jgi:HTH-type transcriptional regulator/antitoxin HigA
MHLFSAEKKVAEAFPPGEFIKDELEARGWTQADLAEILGRNAASISQVISGKQVMNPRLAKGLGAAFGTSPQLWMNLESSYRLWLQEHDDEVVEKRAKLYTFAPIKEMVRRNWIEPSESVDILEQRVCDFFDVPDLETSPTFAHAARQSLSYGMESMSKFAWLFRAKHLAKGTPVHRSYSPDLMPELLNKLRAMLPNIEDISRVPRLLAEAGIRLVVVEHLPQTKIDGAVFWLDDKSPVITLSLRIDRLDSFWFTLLHELDHVSNKDNYGEGYVLDINIVGDEVDTHSERPKIELRADKFAAEFAIPERELKHFVARVKPFFSTQKVLGFALRMRVHPAIVVGQLHHHHVLQPAQFRTMQLKAKPREALISSALTDGWGQQLHTNF